MVNVKKISQKAGLPPGILIHVGDIRSKEVTIRTIDYDQDGIIENKYKNIDELISNQQQSAVRWIQIVGIHNVDLIGRIGEELNLHPLIQEDILNSKQVPKIEQHGNYLYIAAKQMEYTSITNEITMQQVSIILSNGYLLTFQEHDNGLFRSIEDRLFNTKSKIRTYPTDYLAYTILDSIVDNYYHVLEHMGEKIEILENNIMRSENSAVLQDVNKLKKEMIMVRKAVWPMREIINSLSRGDSDLFNDSTLMYIRDIYDHTVQIIDTIEMYRDMVSGMLDIYLSQASNRLSEVMKVLTIISTFFIPLTFITGLYGMNFKHIPGLEWPWAYPLVIFFMLIICLIMFRQFRKKRWL